MRRREGEKRKENKRGIRLRRIENQEERKLKEVVELRRRKEEIGDKRRI